MSDTHGTAPGTGTLKKTKAERTEPDPVPLSEPEAAGREKADGQDQDAERPNDPRPDKQLWDMKKRRALAEASKPIEPAAEAIWSADPEKEKARKAIEDAYRKAARKGKDRISDGELRERYERVNDKFVDAAADMLRSREGTVVRPEERKKSHLVHWIETQLAPAGGTVRKILAERQQVGTRLMNRLGEREKKRQESADRTKSWERAFGRWSAPDKEIAAAIASYEGRIDQLNADINTGVNRAQAIFSFWFEVAPLHLQLREDKVNDQNAPGVERLEKALEDFPDLKAIFHAGAERKDGSIYLLDPDPKQPNDPPPLRVKREQVLKGWQDAAEKQAEAEANYATRPDAAADLQPRHDKLKDDVWVKGAREALAVPKP
jgi:hypothetical protein